jgi:hypothetical protein
MRVDGVPKQPKVSSPLPRSQPAGARQEDVRPGDVVEISQEVQDVTRLSALAKSAKSEPNPRLQEIRTRVQSGYYDSPQVRERTAEALLAAAPLRETVSEIAQARAAKQVLADIPEVREDRVKESRRRVGTGFYDSPQVRRETAARILDELA